MTPLFSVVVPTFNRAPTLRRALESVLAQTLQDFEILVIDDGGDDSETVVRGVGGQYLRGPALGVAAARNLGIQRAAGAYVAFLDSDDWWYPRKLALVQERLTSHPDVGLFYSRLNLVDGGGQTLWTPRVLDLGPRGYPAIVEGNVVSNSTAVVRRDCLEAVRGFDTSLPGCEDWDLWIRLARIAPMHFIDDVLVAIQHLSEDSFMARHTEVIQSIEAVVRKSLREDPALRANRILAGAAYVKGKVCVNAGDDRQAAALFGEAVRLRPLYPRAAIYAAILRLKWLRHLLPVRLKRALRLPEVYD